MDGGTTGGFGMMKILNENRKNFQNYEKNITQWLDKITKIGMDYRKFCSIRNIQNEGIKKEAKKVRRESHSQQKI